MLLPFDTEPGSNKSDPNLGPPLGTCPLSWPWPGRLHPRRQQKMPRLARRHTSTDTIATANLKGKGPKPELVGRGSEANQWHQKKIGTGRNLWWHHVFKTLEQQTHLLLETWGRHVPPSSNIVESSGVSSSFSSIWWIQGCLSDGSEAPVLVDVGSSLGNARQPAVGCRFPLPKQPLLLRTTCSPQAVSVSSSKSVVHALKWTTGKGNVIRKQPPFPASEPENHETSWQAEFPCLKISLNRGGVENRTIYKDMNII